MDQAPLVLIILAILILIPVGMIVLSMSYYVGKIWAIRMLFGRDPNDEEEHHSEQRP